MDEARRIASNIAKLSELLKAFSHKAMKSAALIVAPPTMTKVISAALS